MEGEYEIPQDIYDRIWELMIGIVNASGADDPAMVAVFTDQLLEYCEEQTAAGHGSGFIWEAAGDTVDESREKMKLYQRALGYAIRNREPTQTLWCEIGELLAAGGDLENARLHFENAREKAIERNDAETEGRAVALSIQLEHSRDSEENQLSHPFPRRF